MDQNPAHMFVKKEGHKRDDHTFYKVKRYHGQKHKALKSGDIFMLLGFFSYFPIVFLGWYYLAKYSYLNLVMKPLNWLANRGLDKYSGGMPEVNIKNLKIEEKKTLEQLVQERIELENKKNPQKTDSAEFRKEIVEKIENEIN